MVYKKILWWLVQIAFLALTISVNNIVMAQSTQLRQKIDIVKGDVVMVNAKWDAYNHFKSGFGVIISLASNKYVVATARHLVFSEDVNQEASSISITDERGTTYSANIISSSKNDDLDLAFLSINKSLNTIFVKPATALTDPVIGTEVWLFGASGKFELRPISATVRSISNDIISLDGLHGWKGSSGAPLFSQYGIIGIYLGLDAISSGQGVTISRIRKEAEKAGIRWDLAASDWDLKSVTIDFVRTDSFPADVFAVYVKNQQNFRVPGKTDAFAGRYALTFDSRYLSCEPQTFDVSPIDSKRRISIQCVPQFQGDWKGERFSIFLADMRNGSYTILAVTARPEDLGLSFQGRLIKSNQDLLIYDLTGQAAGGELVFGTAKFSKDLQTVLLSVRTNSSSVSEQLTRR